MAKAAEKVNFIVPTGNFGDILAGYYAKKMGLPIVQLVCASNKNHVLTDFIRTSEYNIKREFHKTISHECGAYACVLSGADPLSWC
ncbi:hypothetical protein AGMMS4957_21780 [Bacteroidia bacterium]|nr:hypothetical protein AGMMS4957_21780 [Bacteroidia bacterium]